ncbi:hypothetical protein [Streptomyces showdoensis]|uniref:Tat pathway signal sequence domain protein n=1 Tax=Streptomyces showdoensis TaxID=68268 RepID=A0A2P2GFM9_STREW|nr:hypothetical protein [Streptomyces showdoensis]KKZ70318.1 hypothetical protein VO63_29615 [Streptomyces showdoensis]
MRFTTRTGILLATLGLMAGPLSPGGAAPAAARQGTGTTTFAAQRIDPAALGPGHGSGTVHVAVPPAPRPAPRGSVTAGAGANRERLWLLGGLALALAATGLVARAAVRGRRDY